ncbi:MAG: HAMP domain-containing sensor histidine kinase [Nanoarchaeota archaeon]
MIETVAALLHRFFFYLGTPSGDLLKRFIELPLFLLTTYMLLSEYLRTKQRDLKLLAVAFGLLSLEGILIVSGLLLQIYGNHDVTRFKVAYPLADFGLESLAIVFLCAGFLLPVLSKQRLKLFFRWSMIAFGAIAVATETVWLLSFHAHPALRFIDQGLYLIFPCFNIVLLCVLILTYIRKSSPYRSSILLTFIVYLFSQVLPVGNFLLFGNKYTQLWVATHPLPILTTFLFVRVVFLKLSDKAVLYSRLARTERRYTLEKELGRMKDEFISVVSHEFRTPLTSIKLYLTLLKEGKLGKTTSEQNQAIDTLHEESNRLSRLIEDLLSLSRMESGKMRLHVELADLSDLFHDDFYYSLARKKGLAISIRAPKPFLVAVDRERFKQIFINLVSNATKFTENGGITIAAGKETKSWWFSVSDTGKGIDRKYQRKLFSKFFQVEDYMTRKEGGFGLGLAIVKNLVDLHHGKIDIKSTPGKGTTFTLRFPQR